MRATWKQLQAYADSIGARVEREEGTGDVYAYSPRGRVWYDGYSSTLVECSANIVGQSWRPEAYGAMLARMQSGLEDAPDYPGWWEEDE